MNSTMEQTSYWMWTRRKFNATATRHPPPPLFNSPLSAVTTGSSYHESWEEQAFAEDSAGLLGGCIWPPRSYTCSFCRREFRSAQALGGHMNVHRRDRARLKQSSSLAHESSEQYPNQVSHMESNGPNPNPNPNPNTNSSVMGSPVLQPASDQHTIVSPFVPPRAFTNQMMPVRLPSDLELRLELGNWKVREVGSKGKRDWDENDVIICSNKRRRGDAAFPSIIKPSSGNLHLVGRPEVLKLSPSPVEELDLELRLGDPPKVK